MKKMLVAAAFALAGLIAIINYNLTDLITMINYERLHKKALS